MSNANPYPCNLTNYNLFRPNAEVCKSCPDDAAMCKSCENFHTGLIEEITSYSIGKLKGPTFLTDLVDD